MLKLIGDLTSIGSDKHEKLWMKAFKSDNDGVWRILLYKKLILIKSLESSYNPNFQVELIINHDSVTTRDLKIEQMCNDCEKSSKNDYFVDFEPLNND